MENEKQEKKQEKAMTEREQKVADRVEEKKISKEDAEKEVAKESVQEKTGYNVETLAEVGKNVLQTKDTLERPDLKETTLRMGRFQENTVGTLLEKMTDGQVAEDIVKSGLGSEHLSTGKGGLETGSRTVLEKMSELGGASGIEKLLAEASLYGRGMSLDDVKHLTPEALKEKVSALKVEAPKIPEKGMALVKENQPSEKRKVNLAMLKKQEQR